MGSMWHFFERYSDSDRTTDIDTPPYELPCSIGFARSSCCAHSIPILLTAQLSFIYQTLVNGCAQLMSARRMPILGIDWGTARRIAMGCVPCTNG
jgi:hypothetical protein